MTSEQSTRYAFLSLVHYLFAGHFPDQSTYGRLLQHNVAIVSNSFRETLFNTGPHHFRCGLLTPVSTLLLSRVPVHVRS